MTRAHIAARTLGTALLVALASGSSMPAYTTDRAFSTAPEGFPAEEQTLRWHVAVAPSHAKPGDDIEIIFTADIANGWILYSSDFELEIGPRPARFHFDANPSLELRGPVQAIGSQRKQDATLGSTYTYFSGKAEFRQRARLKAPLTTITGRIDGQTCFLESGLCELVRDRFSVSLH
jgi:hypothetical protein